MRVLGAIWAAKATGRSYGDALGDLIAECIDAWAMTELECELAAAGTAMPWAAMEMLVALGADKRLIAQLHGAGDLGVARVELSMDGASWDPGGATRRLLLGVRDADGELIDVAALASHRRDEWALRTGDGWALGLDNLEAAGRSADMAFWQASFGVTPRQRATRLRVFANPLDWLAGGGAGICVLDWSAMALASLRALGERVTLQVDPGAQERLRALLAHGGLPRVEARHGPASSGLAA